MDDQKREVAGRVPAPVKGAARKSAGKHPRAAATRRRKAVTMVDGRESAKHEPWSLTPNDRVNLEKSLQAISLLLHTLTDPFGDGKDLDSRIAVGFAIALDLLADQSQGLFSREERTEEKA